MKLAHITTILKHRNLDKSVLSNYRPISNLSFLYKTLECVVAKQPNTYLTNNKILDKFQSAYTSSKSTETAIIQILNLTHISASSHFDYLIILLDLSSAFDTIYYTLLTNRLSSIGITNLADDWFTSYITDRQSLINIHSTLSNPRQTTHGVPQGSVLGSILFNIYIQPLFKIFDNYPTLQYHIYADDIQIHSKLNDPITDFNTINNCITDIHI